MKILFMGTPDFATVSLAHLLAQPDFSVVGVLTQPDKPKGRHMTLTPPPVKVMAMEKGIPVWQPETLKDGAIADLLSDLQPDAIVVVAYGNASAAHEIRGCHILFALGQYAVDDKRTRGTRHCDFAVIQRDHFTGATPNTFFFGKGQRGKFDHLSL